MAATEQLNIRVTEGTREKFRKRAAREGMSQGQLLEALLKQRGKLPAPDPEQTPANGAIGTDSSPAERPPAPGPAPTAAEGLDFSVWLAGRTGVPRALVRRAINAGRVTVAGVPWTSERIAPETLKLGQIVYDGQAV